MSVAATHPGPERLWSYSLFGAVLSAAGLPIYIYAPKYYADTYGISLAALGTVLFGLRLFDVVQDPLFGWLSDRWAAIRGWVTAAGALLLAGSMIALFAVTPVVSPLLWFALSITGLFSAFSFLSINFYAQGVSKADTLAGGHMRLASWRESGALLGVCLAAMAPTLLDGVVALPFAVFAFGFAAVVLTAALAMAPEWRAGARAEDVPIRTVLADPVARRLLILALVNAAPVAMSSTLFLFFVESRLAAPGWEGGLLVLYFLSAALSAPLWGFAAQRFGARRVLLGAMVFAILVYGWVMTLGAGDIAAFAVICVLSGAAIGADLTLLPALFAARMARIAPQGGAGFGLWAFTSKFSLAFAAVILLPVLEASGFQTGTDNPAAALTTLTILYALVPCALKLIAIALLIAIPLKEV